MCCNCCENTLDLGCFDPCGLTFDTSQTANAINAGTWTIEMPFGRRKIKIEQDFADGEDVIFDMFTLNENYTYENVIIKDPLGNIFTFEKDLIVYDCFMFSTQLFADNAIIL